MLDFERKVAVTARRIGRRVRAIDLEDGIQRRASLQAVFCVGQVHASSRHINAEASSNHVQRLGSE